MKPIKVLFVTHYSGLYGANKSLINLIDGLLEKRDVMIEVLCLAPGDLPAELYSKGVRVHFLDYHLSVFSSNGRKTSCLLNLFRNIYRAISFWKRLGYGNYDIVYSNSSLLNFGVLVSLLFRASHIYHLREFGDLDYGLKRCFPWLFRLCLKLSSKVICISEAIRQHYEVNAGIVIHNGVSTKATPKVKISNEVLNIGLVGVLRDEKGFYEAIRSIFNSTPNGKKIIINHFGNGDYTYLEKCRSVALNNPGANELIFHGFVKDTDLIYQNFDILIVPSFYEALGRVTQEAMCYGVPVVGRNSGGTKELITPSFDGFLFEHEKEISTFVEVIDKNYESFSSNASVTATKFLQQHYCDRIYSLLKVLNQ